MQMPQGVIEVVLAGGKSSRMGGGDKALLQLGGRPLLDHVLERLRPQVAEIVLNANDPGRFAAFGLPVVADRLAGQMGPLAGIHASPGPRRTVRRAASSSRLPPTRPSVQPISSAGCVRRLTKPTQRSWLRGRRAACIRCSVYGRCRLQGI